MRELHYIRPGKLRWHERPQPQLQSPGDVIVRPFVAGRCDGDTVPIHQNVSRLMQLGLILGVIDPSVRQICGPIPFKGPIAIGHECVAEVIAVGAEVKNHKVGDEVIVPWAVSCGNCLECRRGLTAKCSVTRNESLAAYGFGSACGNWGGMIVDELRVPFADHMLVQVPAGVPPLRVAAASDNLADAWRSIVPQLNARPGGKVIILGGGAQSIGLYAAGLAVRHGAIKVDYLDHCQTRLDIASKLGASTIPVSARSRKSLASTIATRYDIAVEASSRTDGLESAIRLLAPGGVCTATGYYLGTCTKIPVMHMYATSATLSVGISHVRPVLPELLDFIAREQFPAEEVTTLTANWEDAPEQYCAKTTKLVLYRDPLRKTQSRTAQMHSSKSPQ